MYQSWSFCTTRWNFLWVCYTSLLSAMVAMNPCVY
jgi:hypothetical protein